MSSIKCVGIMAAAGAALSGGITAYNGLKTRKNILKEVQKISDSNGGKIPTGGMTKDGKLWDGFTTVDDIKKDSKKKLAIGTAANAVAGAVSTAVISGLTLLLKSHIK